MIYICVYAVVEGDSFSVHKKNWLTSRSATLSQEAVLITKISRNPKYAIFSNSLSALAQLEILHYTHPF